MINQVIREIRENPEAREEVRRLILTDELLSMPTVLAEVVKTQNQMAALLARMDERQDQMEADITTIRTDVAAIHADMRDVKGASLETYLHVEMSKRAANLFDLRRVSIVRGPILAAPAHDFEDEVADAQRRNAISAAERLRIFDTDLIVRGQGRETGQMTYVAVEAAFTIGFDDLRKVSNSVTALGKVFGEAAVIGAVYGVNISDVIIRAAEERNYKVIEEKIPT